MAFFYMRGTVQNTGICVSFFLYKNLCGAPLSQKKARASSIILKGLENFRERRRGVLEIFFARLWTKRILIKKS